MIGNMVPASFERWLENALAEDILRGKIENKEIVEVEAGDDRLDFHPPKGGSGRVDLKAEDPTAQKPARRRKKGEEAE
jgi:hypothetical protein